MSDFENLKQYIQSMADQSRGCSQFLNSACQQISGMISTLMQLMEGSSHPKYKETLVAMRQAIVDLKDASQYLEVAATTGEDWASEQKVLSKSR